MKTIVIACVATLILTSCDPNSNKRVGNSDRFNSLSGNGNGGGGGVGTGGGGSQQGGSSANADAPLDGGLSVLLLAGAAYGAKRFRRSKKVENEAV